MKKKQLERVAGAYGRELVVSAENLLPGFSMDAVHRFRVQYKKLRALLRMIQTDPAVSGRAHISKKLKRVYRISGSIRDLQLHQQRINTVYRNSKNKPGTYLLHLKQRTTICKRKLKEVFSTTAVAKEVEKIMPRLSDSFSKKMISEYMEQQWGSIVQLIDTKQLSDTNMHRVRKLMKDLFYNMELPGQENLVVETGKRKRVVSLELFKTKLHQLGQFQDLTTEIRMLGTAQLQELPVAAQKQMEKLRAARLAEKNKLKRSLLEQLKTM